MPLKDALAQINKLYGDGSIVVLGDNPRVPVKVISTGSLLLDDAIGVGGFPRSRVVEIFGPESTGKTTIALQVIAQAQKAGGKGAIIDAEHALDLDYAEALGVNVKELVVSQPNCGEEALEIADRLIRCGDIDVIVIDSVAALTPKAEVDGQMGDSFLGLHARLMSQALRKLTAILGKSETCLVFINQIRMKIGVVYGSPETTSGGIGLKFYSSLRLDVRRGELIKDGDKVIGAKTRIKLVKNKLSVPAKVAEVDMIYGKGFDKFGELVDMGTNLGLVIRSGSWYSLNGERIGQGRANVTEFLQSNPDVASKLEQQIREKSKG